MTGAPSISVVLPVFNAVDYVAASVASTLAQSHEDFELLILDDGSNDGSFEVIRRTVGRDERCRVVSGPNKGLVATCNEGVQLARGQYIFRMDADDVAHPNRFAMQIGYLQNHPETVALGTGILLADEDLLPIVEPTTRLSHDEIDAANLSGSGSAICHPTAAIRRDALLAVGGYRAEYEWAEDLDLFLRLAEVGKLANLPDVLLTYRQHLKSIGYSKRALQVSRANSAIEAARKRRGTQDIGGSRIGETAVESSLEDGGYSSVADIHRKWGWLALMGGNLRTARRHAMAAVRLQPLNRANLRLVACVLRGH